MDLSGHFGRRRLRRSGKPPSPPLQPPGPAATTPAPEPPRSEPTKYFEVRRPQRGPVGVLVAVDGPLLGSA
jgi:hypothetical protein